MGSILQESQNKYHISQFTLSAFTTDNIKADLNNFILNTIPNNYFLF